MSFGCLGNLHLNPPVCNDHRELEAEVLEMSKVVFNDKDRRRAVKQILKQHDFVSFEYSGTGQQFMEDGSIDYEDHYTRQSGEKLFIRQGMRYKLTYTDRINGEEHFWLMMDGDVHVKR